MAKRRTMERKCPICEEQLVRRGKGYSCENPECMLTQRAVWMVKQLVGKGMSLEDAKKKVEEVIDAGLDAMVKEIKQTENN